MERTRSRRLRRSIFVMLLGAAFLAGGTGRADLRSGGQSRAARRAYDCAEAGLSAGGEFFRANAANWSQYLTTGFTFTGTFKEGGTSLIYIAGISDNLDEFPPAPPNPSKDSDSTVLIRSTCTDPSSANYAMIRQYLTLADPNTLGAISSPGTVTYKGSVSGTDPNGNVVVALLPPDRTPDGRPLAYSGIKAVGVDMRNDQIALAVTTTLPFIWLSNSEHGTVSKIDRVSGAELGRYRTGPSYGNPSRTTVDLDGNVWVGNRGNNTITKIGLFENGSCVDRNGDGVITTSTGPRALPWKGDLGSVDGAQDECILANVAIVTPDRLPGPSGIDMVVVDPRDNSVIVGGNDSPKLFRVVKGTSGYANLWIKVDSYTSSAIQGHYGGVIDRYGFLWSIALGSSKLEKAAPDFSSVTYFDVGAPADGIALDVHGRIWTSSTSPVFSRLHPDGTNLQVFGTSGRHEAQGIVTTGNGDVWIAGSLGKNHVGRYDNDGGLIQRFDVGRRVDAMVVDGAGQVFLGHPNHSVSSLYPTGGHSYTYSDVTGFVVRKAGSPAGTWTVTQLCSNGCKGWQSIAWDAQVPAGTTLDVRARSAATHAALGGATWFAVKNKEAVQTYASGLANDVLLEVEIRLVGDQAGITPTVYDVNITPY